MQIKAIPANVTLVKNFNLRMGFKYKSKPCPTKYIFCSL